MLETGFCAEVIVGGEHLRLFSEDSPLGLQASVYNVTAKKWIAPSESVNDIEAGKDRAAEHAAAYLRRVLNAELPALVWKKSRSL
jgi:hypothetical protein